MYYIDADNVIVSTNDEKIVLPIDISDFNFLIEDEYVYEDNRHILFSVLPAYRSKAEDAIVTVLWEPIDLIESQQLVIDNGTLFDLCPGSYYYTVRLIYEGNKKERVVTLIKKTKLIIVEQEENMHD